MGGRVDGRVGGRVGGWFNAQFQWCHLHGVNSPFMMPQCILLVISTKGLILFGHLLEQFLIMSYLLEKQLDYMGHFIFCISILVNIKQKKLSLYNRCQIVIYWLAELTFPLINPGRKQVAIEVEYLTSCNYKSFKARTCPPIPTQRPIPISYYLVNFSNHLFSNCLGGWGGGNINR